MEMENEKNFENDEQTEAVNQEIPQEEIEERGLEEPTVAANGSAAAEATTDQSDLGDPTPGATAESTGARATEAETVEVENVGGEPSPSERVVGTAREQAGVAAEALRRGEFMREVAVDPSADNDDRLIAMLSYATQILIPVVMPIIVLLSESSKKRPFQRFHAIQSLALMGIFVLVSLLAFVGTAIVGMIPVIGWLVAAAVACLSPIAVLMAWFALAYYGYQAYQGKKFAIPGLTSFLKDQGWL